MGSFSYIIILLFWFFICERKLKLFISKQLVSKTQLLLLYLGLLQYFDHHGQIETIAKNFKIFSGHFKDARAYMRICV